MNRAALNSITLGQTSTNPWVTMAASVAMRMTTTARGVLFRHASVAQTLYLSGTVAGKKLRHVAIALTLLLRAAAIGRHTKPRYSTIAQLLSLSCMATASKHYVVRSTGTATLRLSSSNRGVLKRHCASTQLMRLRYSSNFGRDFATGAASADRTAVVGTQVRSAVVAGAPREEVI